MQSKLFPVEFSEKEDAGFYDIIPEGFEEPVSIYLGSETVKDDQAIGKAAAFFDKVPHWNTYCREVFLSLSESEETAQEYFDFYRDEVPEVFGVPDPSQLSLKEMIAKLRLKGMATHHTGASQTFVVDFTLGYDQLLCVYFDSERNVHHIAWES